MTDRIEALRRADQIRAFRAELDAMRAAGVSPLTAEQHESIRASHDAVLARLAIEYDVDSTIAAGQTYPTDPTYQT